MINLKDVEIFNREILQSDGVNIVRFCAKWSGPCHIMGPIYEEMDAIYNNSASFYMVDIDDAPTLKNIYGITELPTILFFQAGVVVDFTTGFISRESLIKKLEKGIK